MTPLWQFLTLLAAHWVADFILQSHWMASNKSKRLDALALHVGTYICVFLVVAPMIFGPTFQVLWFVLVNGALHFATDYVTSRITSKLYANQDWHNFFVVIGFDQLIHQTTLAVTMRWLLS